LVFKMTQPTTANKVRIWVGNEEAAAPAVDDTYGQYNCYDEFWRGFWPDGGGISNQTQYSNNTATANKSNNVADALIPLYGAESGPMGANATDYNQGLHTYWLIADWITDQSLAAQKAWTMICAHYRDNLAGQNLRNLLRLYRAVGFAWQRVGAGFSVTDAISEAVSDDGVASQALSSAGDTAVANWRHHAAVFASDDLRTAYIDGGNAGSEATNFNTTLDHLQVGSDFAGNPAIGEVAMTQIHTAARSAGWVDYQAQMMDQVTFWGTIGEFQLQNTAPVDSLLVSACPVGTVPQTEVGTWDGYALLTPEDPSDGSVSKFSHMIDLSELPAGWWTQAVARGKSGLDIRATDTANTIIPFDLIEINLTNSTGLGVIRRSQAEGAPSSIRLWVGNASAITVDPCNAYGQYMAYDSDWRGFWPSGSGTDRTQYQNDMTATGSPATEAEDSELNSTTTVYNNELSTAQYATATNLVPDSNPITLMASYKKPSGEVNNDSVLAAVQDSDARTAVMLHTRPSATPARLTNRNAFGTQYSAANSTSVTATNWNFHAGTSYGNHTRISYVGEATGSSTSSQDVVIVNNLDRITIAAEYATTPLRGMNATIAFVGLHQAARGSAWISYWAKSLDQATFWTVGAWTADPTALS